MKKNLWLMSIPALVLTGCVQVPPASVGIKFNAWNGISEKLVKPQVVFVAPMERVIIYPTSIKNATYTRAASEGERRGDDAVLSSTKEGAILPVDVTVAYHVEPDDVVKAFANFGTSNLEEVQTQFIRLTTNFAVNAVSGRKSIFDLTSKERAQFSPEVKAVIAPILLEMGITVDDVYIGEVFPSDGVQQKIEERIATRNQLELAKVELQRGRIDAETILTNAKKEAEQNRLLALQAEKAIALKRLELLKKAITKWDGAPPLVGPNTIPFTDLDPRQLQR